MRRLLLLALFLVAAAARAETMTVAQYVASLEQIHAHLAAKQFEAAKTEAMRIGGIEVSWQDGTFLPDQSLLETVKASARGDYRLRERIRITVEEIRRTTGLDTAPVDPKMLRAVANEQKVPDLVSGGEIAKPVVDDPLLEQIAESIAEV